MDVKAQENEDGTIRDESSSFFGGNANERAQEIDDGTTECFLGGNMDEKAQENEDETIKSKKERLEGVCERLSACSAFFFFVSNKTVVKLYGNGSSALFREANAMGVRFYRSASVSPNPDKQRRSASFSKERRKRAIDLTRGMLLIIYSSTIIYLSTFFSKTRRVQPKQIGLESHLFRTLRCKLGCSTVP